jgi:hypothetical protein
MFAIAFGEVDPPARDDPIVPTTAMPPAMDKQTQNSARNRNVRRQLRFVIISVPVAALSVWDVASALRPV